MSNGFLFSGGGVPETITNADSGTGIALTSAGSGGAFGPWVEITATTSSDYAGLVVEQMTKLSNASLGGMSAFELAVGAGGSEVMIAGTISLGGSKGEPSNGPMYLPVGVKQGQRLSARAIYNVEPTSTTLLHELALTGVRPGLSVPTFATAFSVGYTSAANNTELTQTLANSYSAWTELTAATSHDYRALTPIIGDYFDLSQTNASNSFSFGFGAGGSEVTIMDLLHHRFNSTEFVNRTYRTVLPIAIPAGTRIAARNCYQTANLFAAALICFR